MDACHLLLGRPWQFDLDANHKGRDNIFVFLKNGQKFVLNPLMEKEPLVDRENSSFLLVDQKEVWNDLKETEQVFRNQMIHPWHPRLCMHLLLSS